MRCSWATILGIKLLCFIIKIINKSIFYKSVTEIVYGLKNPFIYRPILSATNSIAMIRRILMNLILYDKQNLMMPIAICCKDVLEQPTVTYNRYLLDGMNF